MAANKVDNKYDGKPTMEIEKRIETLTLRMNQLAKDGNYLEADNDNLEIKRLQDVLAKRRNDETGLKQKAEYDEIRKAYAVLKEQFNALWNEEMNKFDRDSAKQVVAMKNRQELEVSDLSTRLENERENYPKFSTEIIELRKNEKLLVLEKKFKEALKVKERADLLQVAEVQKFEKSEDARIKSIMNQLYKRQEEEKNGLGRRLDRERKELQIQRDADFRKIEQRFNNLQKEKDSKNRILANQEKKIATFEHQTSSNVKITMTFQDHQAVKFPQALAPLLAKNQGPAGTTKSTTKKFGGQSMGKSNRSTQSATRGGTNANGGGGGTGANTSANGSKELVVTPLAAPAAGPTPSDVESDVGGGGGGDGDAETDPALADQAAFYGAHKIRVVVSVVRATVNEKQDLVSKGDPYVVVKVGEVEKRTKAVNNTLQPVWNEQFTFEDVSESDANNLALSLWDEDLVSKNELIGSATLSTLSFRSARTPVSVPVKDGQDKERGRVELEVEVQDL